MGILGTYLAGIIEVRWPIMIWFAGFQFQERYIMSKSLQDPWCIYRVIALQRSSCVLLIQAWDAHRDCAVLQVVDS